MPSESVVDVAKDVGTRALDALGPRIEAFQAAVAAAEEEVRSYATQRRGRNEFKGEQALVELGPFAIGRIDPERFAMLMGDAEELTPVALTVLDRADTILAGFVTGVDPHRVEVEPGGDLRDTVKEALAYFGQVFGTARAVELARSGVFDADQHNRLLGPLSFRHWNRAERHLSPPLVVDLRGEDCLPAGLGEFLDGTVTIVLVATGLTTPAPLARLVTPGTFVMQTAEPDDLRRLVESPHPGVALLFDTERPEQARFVHDPDAGDSPSARLSVQHMPEQPDVGRGRRQPLWLEELAHLRTLAEAAPAAAAAATDRGAAVGGGGAAEASAAEPADHLAAWLLSQTDLTDL